MAWSDTLADDERGPAAQKRLERDYRRRRPTPEDAVFFESFYGQSASDNPLGIDRALARLRPQTARQAKILLAQRPQDVGILIDPVFHGGRRP